jgi:hypothetical protein
MSEAPGEKKFCYQQKATQFSYLGRKFKFLIEFSDENGSTINQPCYQGDESKLQ